MNKQWYFPSGAAVLLLVLSGCDRASQAKKEILPTYSEKPLAPVRARLLDGMVRYMRKVANCGYTQEDIDHCASILDKYQASLASGSAFTKTEIRNAVKKAVLDLNALNNKCGGGLIETDQREYICQLLLASAQAAGIGTKEDITEEWRDW